MKITVQWTYVMEHEILDTILLRAAGSLVNTQQYSFH